ncbi:Hypothetical protein PENO1_039600 [Penicillium occitanis (nom. inval.)]|nr:Hypothetical protein PENO1_039600 [Penicillium occitanis (nom. inval.)]PCH10173.1 hypothetical protein PENOC_004370 [Penicillium occitanis (nom. inval.)]
MPVEVHGVVYCLYSAQKEVTQAALSQDTRYTPGTGNATAVHLTNDRDFQSDTINEAMAVMMNAMYTSANSTYNFDAPLCSSGNCDWSTFGSLAVCSQTNDITDQLPNKWQPWNWGPELCQNCTYSGLPNGFYLNYNPSGNQVNTSNVWLSTKEGSAWSQVYSFTNDTFGPNALNAVQVIYLDSSTDSYYNASIGLANATLLLSHSRATETLFYICAQTYDVSTNNGTAMITINATAHSINDTQNVTIVEDADRHYNIYTNHTFILDGQNYSYYFIDRTLGEMLYNFASGWYNNDVVGDGLDVMTPFSYAVGNTLYHTANVGDGVMRQALANMVDNMAKGLTNWLRSKGTTVEGQANTLKVFVVVRWDFLIFLGVQVILSAAFLVWIVADSRRRKTKILKESALATLLAIPGSDKEYLEGLLSATEEGGLGAERRDVEQNSRARLIKDAITGQWSLKVVDQKV